MHFESVLERRRRAPFHFLAKADNARFAAYFLSREAEGDIGKSAAAEVQYGGSTAIALGESFRREAAIALELVLKAVIAQSMEVETIFHLPPTVTKVPMNHDIPKLWSLAALPTLSQSDRRVLLYIKRILYWAGRYAAPKNDEDFDREEREDKLLRPPARGPLKLSTLVSLDWETFDRLYLMASSQFWSLRTKYGL